jgi:hypothetical protein
MFGYIEYLFINIPFVFRSHSSMANQIVILLMMQHLNTVMRYMGYICGGKQQGCRPCFKGSFTRSTDSYTHYCVECPSGNEPALKPLITRSQLKLGFSSEKYDQIWALSLIFFLIQGIKRCSMKSYF